MQMANNDEFILEEEDYYALKITKTILHKLLKRFDLSPLKIIGIGNFLYALERLPLKTEGVNSYVELSYTAGNEIFHESKTFGFRIEEEIFEIEVSGYVHDEFVGGDGIRYPGWYIEADGGRDTEADLVVLEEELSEFLNMGINVSVDDYSEIKYEIE